MKFLSRLACLGLLSLLGLTRAEAQNSSDCGNLNQRACQHSDWARMNLVTGEQRACEVDLRENGGYCRNDRRNSLGVRRSQWAAWALEDQLLGSGKDTSLNFLSWPGAHQAYANPRQGFPAVHAQQSLSITDQLNAGVRLLRLDVRSFLSGASEETMRLCGGENSATCAHPEGRFRLFGYALQEVANWVDANPGQVVLLWLHNDPLFGQRVAGVHDEVQRILGTRVFQDQITTGRRWPTPFEVRGTGKSVVVMQFQGPTEFRSNWIWSATGMGQSNDRVLDHNLEGCVARDGMDLNQRGTMAPFTWWDVAESRNGGMLDAATVRKAVRCGVASVGLTEVQPADERLAAMVWSWAEGDWGLRGPALLNQEGRWNSAPETQLLPVACAVRRPGGSTVQDRGWQVTRGAVAWGIDAGNQLCEAEFGANYLFGKPENAYQNHALATVAAGRQVWLRHKVEFPGISLNTRKLVFQMSPRAAIPPAQNLVIGGPVGTFVSIKAMPGLPLSIPATVTTLPGGLFALPVGLGAGVVSMTPGSYSGSLQLTAGGQTTAVEVELIVRAAPSLSVVADPATAVQGGEITLRLDLTGGSQPGGEYTIFREGHGAVANGVMTPVFGGSAVAKATMKSLPLGTHTLLAMTRGDERNQPASGRPVTVTVRPRLAANPPTLEWQMFLGGALPARDLAVTGLGASPVAATGCTWLKAIMVGSLLRVEGTETIRQMALGTYQCEVTVTDALTAQGLGRLVLPVTLALQASLTALPGGELLLAGDGTASQLVTLASSAATGVEVSVSANVPWLQVTPENGMRAPGVFRVTASGNSLPYGRHRGEVVFRSTVTPDVRVPVMFDRVKPTLIETHPAGMPVTVDGKDYRGGGTFYWTIGSEHQLEMLPYFSPSERQTPRGWEIQNSVRSGAKATLVATSQGGYVTGLFDSWFRLQLLPDSNGTIGVTASTTPDGEFYRHGTHVELTARPNIGFGDVTWNVDFGLGQVTSNEQKMLVTIFSPTVVRAKYHPQEARRVEISVNVPGVMASVDGVMTTLPAYFTWYPRSSHTIFVAGTAPISAQSRYRFVGWGDGPTSLTRQITMPNGPLRLQTTYRTEHLVTVSASPEIWGTVHGGDWYAEGATATLRATPAIGYVFTGFTGDVNSAQAVLTVAVPGPLNLVARFAPGLAVVGAAPKKELRNEGAAGFLSHPGQAEWRMNAAASEGVGR